MEFLLFKNSASISIWSRPLSSDQELNELLLPCKEMRHKSREKLWEESSRANESANDLWIGRQRELAQTLQYAVIAHCLGKFADFMVIKMNSQSVRRSVRMLAREGDKNFK